MARFPVGKTKEEFEAAVDDLVYDWFKPFEGVAPEQGDETGQVVGGFTPPDDAKPYALACKRYPVAKLYNDKHKLLPAKYVESLEQNQQIASCCRHPENHEIEAWYSSEADKAKGVPDIYINYCTCGRRHRRFCVGGGERPFWDVR